MCLILVIYYSHPMEFYGTRFEIVVKELVSSLFGRTYYIDNFGQLSTLDIGVEKKLKLILDKIGLILGQYREVPKEVAGNIAYKIMDIVKNEIAVRVEQKGYETILLNPSIFSDPFLRSVRTEEFKRKSFPYFCYGLIYHCDFLIAHGYILNKNIKEIIVKRLEYIISNIKDHRVKEYCCSLIELIKKASDMVWSPGTIKEIKYAIDIGKKCFIMRVNRLEDLTPDGFNKLREFIIPFDKHGLRLYNKIWRPIIKSITRNLMDNLLN